MLGTLFLNKLDLPTVNCFIWYIPYILKHHLFSLYNENGCQLKADGSLVMFFLNEVNLI